ncbi:Protein of unknown function [Bacillus cytotoxicus]|nr:Protein of unknown function [Bacillus cytotoxicus]
MSNDAR